MAKRAVSLVPLGGKRYIVIIKSGFTASEPQGYFLLLVNIRPVGGGYSFLWHTIIMSIKKQLLITIMIMVFSLLAMLVFAGQTSPNPNSAVPVIIMLVLVYILSVSLISLILVMYTSKSWSQHATFTMLLGCIPPALIMIASLRQATAFDLVILFATAILIAWYATYKK